MRAPLARKSPSAARLSRPRRASCVTRAARELARTLARSLAHAHLLRAATPTNSTRRGPQSSASLHVPNATRKSASRASPKLWPPVGGGGLRRGDECKQHANGFAQAPLARHWRPNQIAALMAARKRRERESECVSGATLARLACCDSSGNLLTLPRLASAASAQWRHLAEPAACVARPHVKLADLPLDGASRVGRRQTHHRAGPVACAPEQHLCRREQT